MRDRRGLEVLPREECLRRLGRGGIGRVAVTIGALPAIFPVNYAVLDDDIVFRTAPGAKLTAALQEAVIAFEVDQADLFAHTGWSVTVVGPSRQIVDPDELARARTLPLTAWAPSASDVFVRVESQLVSGRLLTHVVAEDDQWWAGPVQPCPACSSDALVAVSDGELTNFVCTTCFACWHVNLGAIYQLPASTCPGCGLSAVCRAAHRTQAPANAIRS